MSAILNILCMITKMLLLLNDENESLYRNGFVFCFLVNTHTHARTMCAAQLYIDSNVRRTTWITVKIPLYAWLVHALRRVNRNAGTKISTNTLILMNEFICHVIYHGFVLFAFVHVCVCVCVWVSLSLACSVCESIKQQKLQKKTPAKICSLLECLKECIRIVGVSWSILSENEKNNKSSTKVYQKTKLLFWSKTKQFTQ